MTIEQAQLVSELLEDRDNIKAILHRVKADDCLMVCMANNVKSIPKDALPYVIEALEKAKCEIETKISEI